jgi:ParB family chromosome partitioning protein
MSTIKRRLGRGLDALLGGSYEFDDSSAATTGDPGSRPGDSTSELVSVRATDIESNPFQPRQTFDPLELAALVDSIHQHGVLQPVVVRRVGERYQLVAGERRLRAAQQAGLANVPARVIEADDQQVFELAIVENLQRTDLNPIEKARAFHDYIARFGATQDELATRLGLDRSTVSNFIRLLELPPAIQQTVQAGKLSQGHARALLVVGDTARQHELCRRIVTDGLSVRQTEQLVAAERPLKSKTTRSGSSYRTSYVAELEGMLRERLGAQVEIRLSTKDRGQIVIHFGSNDDFERILELIQGSACSEAAA